MTDMAYIRTNDKIRWVGYFDLLGTRQLIKKDKMLEVFQSFAWAASRIDALNRRNMGILHVWFSDTFVVLSDDDSQETFAAVELLSRWFVVALIWRNIPVRGSISCGRLYADQDKGLYFGPALVEAYEWSEGQDWIGLVLCPSCIERLEKLEQSTRNYKHYVEYTIPPFMKSPPDDSCRCAARILGDWVKEGNSSNSDVLSNLHEMCGGQKDEKIIRKYRRTIDFIVSHQTSL